MNNASYGLYFWEEKKMKKITALLLALMMLFALTACGESDPEPAADTFTVGICQLVQHAALDAATQGFKDVLVEEFGDAITFEEGNAAGDSATCATICNGFVSSGVDLILANATPALQAAASATNEIPILGTAVTEYGVALSIDNFGGTVGGNISGTSDLAPLDKQAQMIIDLFPAAKTVGILYCSAEANSVYQCEVVKGELEAKGLTVNVYTFTDSNDVSTVTSSACGECDVLYIPTDNVAASCAEAIGAIAEPANVPIITGEEGPCAICGVATLTIDYYELGRTTGQMAIKILKGEADISTMAVEYFPNPVEKYTPTLAEKYGVTIPDSFVAIG